MTFDVEIMLRQNDRVFTERLSHERDAADWTDADASVVLKKILRAIDRVQRPADEEEREVSLRGLSWIVTPFKDGVVIAFEIHSASAVAGPFAVAEPALTRLLTRAMQEGQPQKPTVH